ncbi:MAG: hypothetical protein IJD93_07140 [Ruminococcus sp.]|nr:hypothetical protein [Ruminococcus sp.]
MKYKFLRRVMSLMLCLLMTLSLLPMGLQLADTEAVSGVNSLTCSGFISNSTARTYIDAMMKYYINSSSTLQSTLDNGNSVVFMFEGGSDNYWNGTTYYNGAYNTRTQAVCIVVKKNSSGNAYIAYYCENSSSIPSEPTWCTNGVAYSGSTTLMDGTYSFYTWNHTGPYAAFQINLANSSGLCYYTPTQNLNGYKAGASGINIHTRSTSYGGGSALGWAWSEGCQVIGYGNDSSNEFNGFVKAITGITWNPWISWSSKILNTWGTTGTYKGYYVVDRQLALSNPSGTKYGTGSLGSLYNSTALTNITAKSTAAKNAAGATIVDYLSKCTMYPAHGKLKCTGTDVWTRTLPCYASTDSSTVALSQFNSGDELECTGLVKNTEGEYWYQVLTSSGGSAYVRAAYMEYKQELLNDIKITGHTPPNGHVTGTGYVVSGNISSAYNGLTSVSAYVHNGFGTSGGTATGHKVTLSDAHSYTLAGSTVDNNVLMGVMAPGNFTLAIKVDYRNCYVVNDTTLKTNTGTMLLAEDYFMVISSSVSQSSCSHTNKKYTITESTCTQAGKSVEACTTCGLMGKVTTTTGAHKWGEWVTVEPTCTKPGSKTRTCSLCKDTETQVLTNGGHNYASSDLKATCIDYAKTLYTCTECGHTYSEYKDAPSEWQTEKPVGISDDLIETKTQYSYSEYKTIESYEPSLEGYTLVGSDWKSQGQKTHDYVTSWGAGGFDKTSSLYTKYNVSPLTAYENATDKRVIDSTKQYGYLYYHWCYSSSGSSWEYKTDQYTTFHAYYDTTNPENYTCDTFDMSYKTSNSCCSNSAWFCAVPVTRQTYTDYKLTYTHSIWSDYSDWSDTEATEAWNKKVQTRTLYRVKSSGQLEDHNYVNGVCSVCSKAEPSYYLFGFINGADYGCEADRENIGIYKFTDGVLKVKFTENSYVAVKTGDNQSWYMTDGYQGEGVTSATLYNVNTGINADKLFVPGGREVVFSLTKNSDGTLKLSYLAGACTHDNHTPDGKCTACSAEVQHTYVDGICSVCSKAKPTYYLVGFINGADYGIADDSDTIGDYKFVDGKLTATFTENSYVAFKTGDNSEWYNTDGYKGKEYTSAVFYNAEKLGDNANKLFIPKGREITFTLTDNGNGSFTLSYVAAECPHETHDINGICSQCGEEVGHVNENGVCTVCGYNCNHKFEDGVCTICGKEKPYYYLVGFINGRDFYSEDFKFDGNQLTTTFDDYSYLAVKSSEGVTYMTNGYLGESCTIAPMYDSTQLGNNADKLYVPKGREITVTLVENDDLSITLYLDIKECEHKEHSLEGICTKCDAQVEHTKVDGVCIVCGHICDHDYVNGVCINCGMIQPVYYLYGFIDGEQYDGSDYRFKDETLSVKFTQNSYIAIRTEEGERFLTESNTQGVSAQFYNVATGKGTDMFYIPSGVEVEFTLSCAQDGVITLSYEILSCEHHKHDKDGSCLACAEKVDHTYENDSCTICGRTAPDFYLFGFINGENYACEEDAENMGIYKFSKGKLVVVFTENSYVSVKTEDNEDWYMTEGYQNDKTSVTLYNTDSGIAEPDRLFVPKGRLITFTVVRGADDTLTLSYTAAPCLHVTHSTSGECTTCGEVVEHTYKEGICSGCALKCQHYWHNGKCVVCEHGCNHIWIDASCVLCGYACPHSFTDGICTSCGTVCTHSYEDGECVICSDVCAHSFRNGICKKCSFECKHSFENNKCTECKLVCVHNFEDGRCTVCHLACEHSYSHGECEYCGLTCEHKFKDYVCTVCGYNCSHSFENGRCMDCGYVCAHTYKNGKCTECLVACEHSFEGRVCTICHSECEHSFKDNTCTACNYTAEFYLVGYINGENIGCEENAELTGPYSFTEGNVTIEFAQASAVAVKTADSSDWYLPDGTTVGTSVELCNARGAESSDMLHIPAGVVAEFTLSSNENGKLVLSYELSDCQHTSHRTDGLCSVCSAEVEHTYEDGKCTVCSLVETSYYLFGIINGEAYGCEEDADTLGNYKFKNGKLTVTFEEDSYIGVKTGDNMSWFMTDGDQGQVPATVLFNTLVYGIDAKMLFVPGNSEVTFTINVSSFDTITISYTATQAKPELTPKFTRLSLEDGVAYEVCFKAENLGLVPYSDMGLALFESEDATEAYEYLAGVCEDGRYLVASTDIINPKTLGDTVYFKVYAVLSDGTYIYSDMLSENAADYAQNVLQNPAASKELKALMVSLLNFGAEAQVCYGYKTSSLANAGLTAAQKALAKAYSADMADKTEVASASKTVNFTKTAKKAMLYPTVGFDTELFAVNYNLVLPDAQDEVKLYYWTEDAYLGADELTTGNATAVVAMTKDSQGIYTAQVKDISAKDIDKTIYVCVVYTSQGETLCTGVVSYSVADFCKLYAENNSADIQPLAQAAIVYGYYAKKCFDN